VEGAHLSLSVRTLSLEGKTNTKKEKKRRLEFKKRKKKY